MIKTVSSMLYESIFSPWLEGRLRRGSIQAAQGYVNAVGVSRQVTLSLLILGAAISMAVSGLVLFFVGFLSLFHLVAGAFATTVLVVGVILIAGASIGIFDFFREGRWLKVSRANEVIDAALSPWPDIVPPKPSDVIAGRGPHGAFEQS